jgi:hypothetical protein
MGKKVPLSTWVIDRGLDGGRGRCYNGDGGREMAIYDTADDIRKIKEATAGWTVVDFGRTKDECIDFHLVRGNESRLVQVGSNDLGVWLEAVMDKRAKNVFIMKDYKEFISGLIYDSGYTEIVSDGDLVGYSREGKTYFINRSKIEEGKTGLYVKEYDPIAMCLKSSDPNILMKLGQFVMDDEKVGDEWLDFFYHGFSNEARDLFFEVYFGQGG